MKIKNIFAVVILGIGLFGSCSDFQNKNMLNENEPELSYKRCYKKKYSNFDTCLKDINSQILMCRDTYQHSFFRIWDMEDYEHNSPFKLCFESTKFYNSCYNKYPNEEKNFNACIETFKKNFTSWTLKNLENR